MAQSEERELSEALRQLFASLAARAASERFTRLIEDIEAGRAAPTTSEREVH